MSYSLRDHLSTYPGGVVALARDIGRSASRLYGFCAGEGKRVPVAFAGAIARRTSQRRSLDGELMTREWLLARWQAARSR